LYVHALERAIERRLEHVGNAQARFGLQWSPPRVFERLAHDRIGHVAVGAELMGEGAHVARALHVVLPAQRVHADAFATQVAGGHGEVGDAHDRGRALAVLGDAEAIVDGAVASGGVQARRAAHTLRSHARDGFRGLWRIALFGDERLPLRERLRLAA